MVYWCFIWDSVNDWLCYTSCNDVALSIFFFIWRFLEREKKKRNSKNQQRATLLQLVLYKYRYRSYCTDVPKTLMFNNNRCQNYDTKKKSYWFRKSSSIFNKHIFINLYLNVTYNAILFLLPQYQEKKMVNNSVSKIRNSCIETTGMCNLYSLKCCRWGWWDAQGLAKAPWSAWCLEWPKSTAP